MQKRPDADNFGDDEYFYGKRFSFVDAELLI
jgi:hypothetical protein